MIFLTHEKQIELIICRLKEVYDIINTCSDGKMTSEQANVIARFYYDYQDTNIIIDEAEAMATENTC